MVSMSRRQGPMPWTADKATAAQRDDTKAAIPAGHQLPANELQTTVLQACLRAGLEAADRSVSECYATAELPPRRLGVRLDTFGFG